MSKKDKIVAWIVAIIFWGIIIGLYIHPFLIKRPEVNPEVFPVFRQIEDYCMDYVLSDNVDPLIYERCKEVVELKGRAVNSEFYPADEYYKDLNRLGFELPPLYIEAFEDRKK